MNLKLGLLGLAIGASFLRINETPSVPVGLYVAFGTPHRGQLAEFCPPDAIAEEGLAKGYIPRPGPCYHFSAWMVKELAAVGGDVVDVSPSGIKVNGAMWPGSERRYKTLDGEPITRWMPYGSTRLTSDQVLLLGSNPYSWDSRTWGLISISSLKARMFPILTWKGY